MTFLEVFSVFFGHVGVNEAKFFKTLKDPDWPWESTGEQRILKSKKKPLNSFLKILQAKTPCSTKFDSAGWSAMISTTYGRSMMCQVCGATCAHGGNYCSSTLKPRGLDGTRWQKERRGSLPTDLISLGMI